MLNVAKSIIKQIIYLVYVLGFCALVFVFLEYLSYRFLERTDSQVDFLFKRSAFDILDGPFHAKFSSLDPHLGYTWSEEDMNYLSYFDKTDENSYFWDAGFLIYARGISSLRKPIILTLGGSTTDGIQFGQSWPEELSKLLRVRGIEGTVINGGIGGYSSSQELLKLLRDGFAFKPDIVISYSGWNDRGIYRMKDFPMVHPYQEQILNSIVNVDHNIRILPNLMKFLKGRLFNYNGRLKLVFGLPRQIDNTEVFIRNMSYMNALCSVEGADFFSIIQPVNRFENPRNKWDHSGKLLFQKLSNYATGCEYMHDATQVLEGGVDVWKKDGIHLTEHGNKVIADYILNVIENSL